MGEPSAGRSQGAPGTWLWRWATRLVDVPEDWTHEEAKSFLSWMQGDLRQSIANNPRIVYMGKEEIVGPDEFWEDEDLPDGAQRFAVKVGVFAEVQPPAKSIPIQPSQ